MDIVQNFYDNMATSYHKLFQDWQASTSEQAVILDNIFKNLKFDKSAKILDCACGIGTQSIGLAKLGYKNITASDISKAELEEAKKYVENNNVNINFKCADFRVLQESFVEKFDIIIAMDNALPHMLSGEDLEKAIKSITDQLEKGGVFIASIRDYDASLADKPAYSPPYIHKSVKGQRVSFQTWDWIGDCYKLTQYIIEDEEKLSVSKFECMYRATCRKEITNLLLANGCNKVHWKFPEETGFYQPIVVAEK